MPRFSFPFWNSVLCFSTRLECVSFLSLNNLHVWAPNLQIFVFPSISERDLILSVCRRMPNTSTVPTKNTALTMLGFVSYLNTSCASDLSHSICYGSMAILGRAGIEKHRFLLFSSSPLVVIISLPLSFFSPYNFAVSDSLCHLAVNWLILPTDAVHHMANISVKWKQQTPPAPSGKWHFGKWNV